VEPYEQQLALGTAIAVGLLIGLEREQAADPAEGRSLIAGIRTYPIVALIGALATMLEPVSMWLPLVALIGVIALVAISYANDLKTSKDHGVTSEVSVIATYLLGALATSRGAVEPMADRLILVAALGVALTFLLSSKRTFHGLAAKISRADFYAIVQFLIVAVVVLPLLPHRGLGPLDAIDPFSVGLMVITIAGLSFLGYLAIRLLGPRRGLLVSAALGGLVSSTAVTVAFSTRAKQDPSLAPMASAAISIASTIMVVRIALLVALVAPALLPGVAIPLGVMLLGALVGGFATSRGKTGEAPPDTGVKNPFELGSAMRFGVAFAIVLLATKAAKIYLGANGLYVAAGLAGTTDVDAITLSTAKLATGDLAAQVAVTAIMIAAITNTIVKTGIAVTLGGKALARRALVAGTLMIGGGLVGLVVGWCVH
jgi:uncharacterized membrane protein (DUF4010 family)